MADKLLKEQAHSETCRDCQSPGQPIGTIDVQLSDPSYAPVVVHGCYVVATFEIRECPEGHVWCQGGGTARSYEGENAILLASKLERRHRRELSYEAAHLDGLEYRRSL